MKIFFHQQRHWNRLLTRFCLFFLLGSFLYGNPSYAQQTPRMNINRVTTNGELTIRDYTANFPYPILTTVTVIDGQGNYVTGLADTLRWLGKNDIANNGVPVSQIWSPFFEYHEEDNRIPPVPDVYQQKFGPYVTEIRWCDNFPTSTMLVMDFSSSMAEEISFARAGANTFVDLMRPIDRAGLVQFSGTVLVFQPLTTDTQLLHNLITNTPLDRGTAIYDATLRGIAGVKDVPCRRMVIVYTDGFDVNSTSTAKMVIDTAQTYRVPVFTIALGNETQEDSLRAIADKTGGLFFKAATASEMETIYRRLSSVTQNYYVTAHGSTDPNYNNTWRTVDLTVNIDGRNIRGTGRYFVPGTPPPLKYTDIGIQLSAKTDTFIVKGTDSLPATEPGKEFVYQLSIQNFGNNPGDSIRIVQHLPDSVQYIQTTLIPEIISADSLVWELNRLEVGNVFEISTTVRLSPDVPRTTDFLASSASMTAMNDTTLLNNQDVDTVYVLFPKLPPEITDLTIDQDVRTDTSIIVNGDTIPAVFWGDSIAFNLKIKNKGPSPADSIIIWDIIPDSTKLVNFNIPPNYQHGDTLFWIFDSLAVNDSILISFIGEVVSLFPDSPFPIMNIIGVITDDDMTPDNNIDSTLIYTLEPKRPTRRQTDLTLKFISKTDTSVFIGQREFPAVQAGDAFEYWIEIHNNGPNRADSVQVVQALPDSIIFNEASVIPKFRAADTLKWYFDYLNVTDTIRIQLNFDIAEKLPRSLTELISSVTVFSPADSNLANNFAVDTIKVIFPAIQPHEWNYNLAITQTIQADTIVMIDGGLMQAVFIGKSVPYHLKVKNYGPNMARQIQVIDEIEKFITISQVSFEPNEQFISGEYTISTWLVDSLASQDSLIISFKAFIPNKPYLQQTLTNWARVFAPNDTVPEDNVSYTRIFIIKRQGSDTLTTDISIHQVAQTDSFRILNQDTMRIVHDDEVYQYRIRVRNDRDIPAEDVKIVDYLPEFIEVIESDPRPIITTKDSLVWQPGTLPPQTSIYYTITVRVPSLVFAVETPLINEVVASAKNEDPTQLLNNSAVDTVYYIPTLPDEWTAQIEATPAIVDVGKPVKLKVKTTTDINRWDIWIYPANGKIDSAYADNFIKTNALKANEWLEIIPDYTQTQMLTDSDEEPITFELHARDRRNTLKQAQATVVIQKADEIDIDRNVFMPEKDDPITIKFKLPQDESAALDLYDITGTKITKIAESQYKSGWNAVTWNGLTEHGQKVGSGFYILTLRSNGYSAWKKLMIVR
ncbi:VWA domain-containing protein [candidate division KSB1 bacterium]|nr:VWA domain-containing protein [candidate division KSB1 bacterium]